MTKVRNKGVRDTPGVVKKNLRDKDRKRRDLEQERQKGSKKEELEVGPTSSMSNI